MELLQKLFPLSFRAKNVKELLVNILIYIVANIVCGVVIGLLSGIPLIGMIISLIGSVAGLYFFVGIILAILDYFGAFKK